MLSSKKDLATDRRSFGFYSRLRAVCREEPGLQNFPDTLKMAEVDSDEARRLARNASRRLSYARYALFTANTFYMLTFFFCRNRESINQRRRDIHRLTNAERRSVAYRHVHPFHHRDPTSDRSHRPGSPIRRSTRDHPETQVNVVPL